MKGFAYPALCLQQGHERQQISKMCFTRLMAEAGVVIDGDRPWDMQIKINHEAAFERFYASGSLGMGESFMDGW